MVSNFQGFLKCEGIAWKCTASFTMEELSICTSHSVLIFYVLLSKVPITSLNITYTFVLIIVTDLQSVLPARWEMQF
jgi:hypothetical protein